MKRFQPNRPLDLFAVLAVLAAFVPLLAAPSLAENSLDNPDDASAGRRAIWEWTGVGRVVAVGDLHGSHDKLVRLLASAGLVDDELAWTGGEDHLVIAGDFLDRGSGERLIMDLLRRLEAEAAAVGGRVHTLLGNHEVMNLMRDTRYVSPAAFRSFAREEERQERRAAWRSYSGARIGDAGLAELRRDFQRRYPEGFFARQRHLDLDGDYGAWLTRLPAVVKIDRVTYVHGGITEEMAALGVDGINRRVLDALRRSLELRDELEAGGVVTPDMALTEIHRAAGEVAADPDHPLAATAAAFRESATEEILGARGPLWYRGTALEDERIERLILERSLELLDASAMVIAHTYTGGNKITTRFHGKIYRVDHGLANSERPLALVVESGHTLVLDGADGSTLLPETEMPMGRSLLAADSDLSAEQREKLLRLGAVTHTVELGRGSSRPRLVVLERNGGRARGLFKTVDRALEVGPADRYQHEVAAFAVDRALGLGMVPLTLLREIDGQVGSLQSWVEGAVDREAARAYHLELEEDDSTRRQLARAELFDALIGNLDRRANDVLLKVDDDSVFLIDHSQAFSTTTEIGWDGSTAGLVGPEIAESLRALQRQELENKLGGLLSAAQIDALLARRDHLVDRFEKAGTATSQPAILASD